jgi:hypothetical protein
MTTETAAWLTDDNLGPWLRPRSVNVLFWSGAGLSIDDPTNGPKGNTLTERAIVEYMAPSTSSELVQPYRDLEIAHAEARPRLETVLEALFNVYGPVGLSDVLSDPLNAPPNRHHRLMARHVAAGGWHVTANFDTCIERAAGPLPALALERVVHIHGAVEAGRSVEPLGARLRAIENGLPDAVAKQLDHVLGQEEIEVVVFLGYSGSDFFDVTPYLVSRNDLLWTKSLLWFDWAPHPLARQVAVEKVRTDLPRRLADLTPAPDLSVWTGTLDHLLPTLSAPWGLAGADTVDLAPATCWRPMIERDDDSRTAARTALFSQIGYRTGVIENYARAEPTGRRERDRLADALWGAGRYTDALRAWERAFAGIGDDDQALREERRGAVLWIGGQLRAAERHLWRCITTWVGPGSSVGPVTQARLVETYGRVVLHMRRRFPDTRRRIDPVKVATAVELLGGLRAALHGQEGIQLGARLDSLSADLGLRPDPERDHHVEVFEQSDTLHSWLNYQQGSLRRRVERPAPDDRPPGRADLEALNRRQQVLGALGDAARAHLLPAAASPLEVWRAFGKVEIATWHRLRLVGGFTVVWLKDGVHRLLRAWRSADAR